MPIEAATFIGSSPIRRLVEDWTVDHLQRTTEEAVKFAAAAGLPVMYVTEDTMRTDPSTVITLYSTAIRSGARAIVLCDTVGHATPRGAFNLVKFAIEEVVKPSGEKSRGLARPQRSRPGHRQFASRHCRRCRSSSRRSSCLGRTRRKHPDGADARQSAPARANRP